MALAMEARAAAGTNQPDRRSYQLRFFVDPHWGCWSYNRLKMGILMKRRGRVAPLEVWACIPTLEQVYAGTYDPATVSEIIKRLTSPRRTAKIYKPIELSVLEKVQRVVTNLYRQPADPTEKDVDAALKMLVAQERATFFNLSTNNGVKSGWVRLMKAGDV
jgi:hypothetical protein